jgi:hypothetical protein
MSLTLVPWLILQTASKFKRRGGGYLYLGLDIELARLGSVRLELARYDNELARLDSL